MLLILLFGLGLFAPVGAEFRAVAQQSSRLDQDALILFRGLKVQPDQAAFLVPPGKAQSLAFAVKRSSLEITILSCRGGMTCRAQGPRLTLESPQEPGNYFLEVELEVKEDGGNPAYRTSVRLCLLVGFPNSLLVDGEINGFELGEYPDHTKMRNPEYYKPPEYFYYLDYEVIGLWISEHIRLGDLGYDGRAPIPQFFALDYELVIKLEALIAELRARGLPSRLHFIGGGFISPKSNQLRTAGNKAAASLSRHLWGEAVDFIIDEDPRDGIMDDMNGDGVIDVRDALVVRDVITDLEESGRVKPGGVGVYAPPRNRRVQLHVDVRGYPTRWGVQEYDPEEFAGVPPQGSLRPGGKK